MSIDKSAAQAELKILENARLEILSGTKKVNVSFNGNSVGFQMSSLPYLVERIRELKISLGLINRGPIGVRCLL